MLAPAAGSGINPAVPLRRSPNAGVAAAPRSMITLTLQPETLSPNTAAGPAFGPAPKRINNPCFAIRCFNGTDLVGGFGMASFSSSLPAPRRLHRVTYGLNADRLQSSPSPPCRQAFLGLATGCQPRRKFGPTRSSTWRQRPFLVSRCAVGAGPGLAWIISTPAAACWICANACLGLVISYGHGNGARMIHATSPVLPSHGAACANAGRRLM